MMMSIREGEKVMSSKVTMIVCVVGLFLLSACATTMGPPAVHQESKQTPTSVIVQGDDLDAVKAAVLDVGGEITHELGIINSVGANLTPAQLERLNRTGLVRIHENRSVESSSDEAAMLTVRDEFNAVSWSGNNGTVSWKAPWVEDDAAGAGPETGDIRVVNGELRIDDMQSDASAPGVFRTADLSHALSAEFSFDFRVSEDVELDDYISIEVAVSADGGVPWTILGYIDVSHGNVTYYDYFAETWFYSDYRGTDSYTASKAFDISNFIAVNSTIRLRIDNYYGSGTDDSFFVDNVEIECVPDYVANLKHASVVDADLLHDMGITGEGVCVGVIDTGWWSVQPLHYDSNGHHRVIYHYDAITDRISTCWGFNDSDLNGHGSHVSSTLASSKKNPDNSYHGVAPDASMVPIKAFDENGQGTYADVIRGIDFALSYQSMHHMRVLNCSFSAPPVSLYWDDPLAQAVMAAWDAGIVVVASAGNRGPEPMTIGVPGNVPYVITVGAVSDNLTPTDGTEDFLTSFSSTGPTVEGFVKPELLAPGGHITAMMPADAKIALNHPEFHDDGDYFMMSGTSQSTAVVSGVVALMLQGNPRLTPDEVKSRLIDTARPAVDGSGDPAYSVLQQGAGVANAYDAYHSTARGIANLGLDVGKELAGIEHYGGPVNQLDDGSFYIMEHSETDDGTTWDGSYNWIDAYLWSDAQSLAYLWSDAFGQAYLWSDAQGLAYLWSDSQQFAYLWSDGKGLAYLWSDTLTETMSINCWVPQE